MGKLDLPGSERDQGPESAPKALLLDIMDTVVVDPFFSDELEALFGLDRAVLFERMTPDLWPAFERNELTPEAYYADFFRDGSGVDGAQLEQWMAKRYTWVPGMETLLQELCDLAVPLYALSNYPVWWQLIEDRLTLSHYLAWRFVSCQTGVRKPDAAAYTGPAERLGLRPDACLFVDDRASNCEAAAAIGMQTHHFQGTEGLRVALRSAGIAV